MISELTKTLKVTQEQVCIMAALLGNFLLPERDLQDLYKKLGLTKGENVSKKSLYILSEIYFVLYDD